MPANNEPSQGGPHQALMIDYKSCLYNFLIEDHTFEKKNESSAPMRLCRRCAGKKYFSFFPVTLLKCWHYGAFISLYTWVSGFTLIVLSDIDSSVSGRP